MSETLELDAHEFMQVGAAAATQARNLLLDAVVAGGAAEALPVLEAALRRARRAVEVIEYLIRCAETDCEEGGG